MKNVLMILFMLGGFAMTSMDAQSCCWPCPPGCCILNCITGKDGAAVAPVKSDGTASLASFSPEAMAATCEGKKMSKKEMKSCMTACQASITSAPHDGSHVAPVAVQASGTPVSGCQPVCQPAACQPGKKGPTSYSADAQPTPNATAIKAKS